MPFQSVHMITKKALKIVSFFEAMNILTKITELDLCTMPFANLNVQKPC